MCDTTTRWSAAPTMESKSSPDSSEAASSESSEAPHPSPMAPYGRTLKGGCPTGAPRSRILCQSHQQSYCKELTSWKARWIKLHVSKVWYVKLFGVYRALCSTLLRLAITSSSTSHTRCGSADYSVEEDVRSSSNPKREKLMKNLYATCNFVAPVQVTQVSVLI
jgi:hypothetical protein